MIDRPSDFVSDAIWSGLIQVSDNNCKKIGSFKNRRYERNFVYICRACTHLAMILVDRGVINRWQGGYRRLSAIEAAAVGKFRQIHGVFHTDP